MALRGGAGTSEKPTQLLARLRLRRLSGFRTGLASIGRCAISYGGIAANSPDRSTRS